MRIESLEMHNFRPYRSEKINFSTDHKDNINLVVGPNDHGKTSLMDAIKWVLYGEGNNKKQYRNLVHDGIKDEDYPETYVRMEFTHEGSTFVLVREMEGIDNNRSTVSGNEVSLTVDGEPKNNNIQREIDKILPPQIDRFFFFDAEEIDETAEQSGEMEEKIERVLGLYTVDRAIDHSNYIQGKLDKKLGKKRDQIEHKEDLGSEIEDLKDEKSNIQEEIDKLEEEKNRLEEGIEKIEDNLGNVDETKDLIEKKNKLQKEKEDAEKKLKRIERNRRDEWEGLFRNLIDPYRKSILDTVKNEIQSLEDKRDSKDKRRFKNQFKKEADNEDFCPICEREGELNLNYSESGVEEDESLRDKIKILRSKRDILSEFNSREVSPMELESEKIEVIDHITDIDTDLETISEDLDVVDLSEEDIGKFQEKRKNKKKRLEEIEDELKGRGKKGLKEELEDIQEKIDKKERVYSRTIDDDEVNELEQKIETVEHVENSLKRVVDRVIEKKREGIENEADKIFSQLTNTPSADRKFRLVDQSGYKYTIERSDGSIPKIGEGKKQIMSLSFILGLNHYTNREAPLVMDTPIMRLDRQHRENVADFLSELDDQIILLLTNAEYNQVEGYLDSVAKKMTINKDAEEEHSWFEEGVE